MNEPTMDNMVQRLDCLERENRRLKRIGALVVVGIAAVVLMGQAMPGKVAKVVEAEKFVLRGKGGKIRASLEVRTDGSPGLYLRDHDGKTRAELRLVSGEHPRLALFDQQEKTSIALQSVQSERHLAIIGEGNSVSLGLGRMRIFRTV